MADEKINDLNKEAERLKEKLSLWDKEKSDTLKTLEKVFLDSTMSLKSDEERIIIHEKIAREMGENSQEDTVTSMNL